MLTAALLLAGLYIIYLLYEKRRNDAALSSFRYVIHVNGIRGKTGVCRLLDAVFRGAGFRVFTKTTGSTPVYIDTKGDCHLIKRTGSPNISEQLCMIRKARKENAEVLILECMAVAPELQKTAQKDIVKGNLNVITNVRYDHIFEMGETLPQIAESLAGTIPENGTLLCADEAFFPYFKALCEEKNTKAVLCRADGLPDAGKAPNSLPNLPSGTISGVDPALSEHEPRRLLSETIPRENLAVAWEAAKEIGMDAETVFRSLQNYHEDFGAKKRYPLSETASFFNLFSANDPQSTRLLLDEAQSGQARLWLIYNHRTDRPDRLLLFARQFFPKVSYERLYVIGENRAFAARLLRKNGCHDVSALSDWRELLTLAGKDAKTHGAFAEKKHDPAEPLDPAAPAETPGTAGKTDAAKESGARNSAKAPARSDARPLFLAGIGNIKGAAYALIQYFEEKEANKS